MEVGGGGGEGEIIYLSPHCHHQKGAGIAQWLEHRTRD